MLQDIRYAFRWLRRSPGFALVAVLSIGLGVGVNTAMFSLVDALLFKPLPVSAPSTLVDVFTTSSDGDEYATSSFPDFMDLKAQNDVFADMTGYSPMLRAAGLGERSRLVVGQVVTSNHFTMLGRPAASRPHCCCRRTMMPGRDARRRDLASDVAARFRRRDRGIVGQHAHTSRASVHHRRRGAARASAAWFRWSRRSCGCRSRTSRKWSRPASTTSCRRRRAGRSSNAAACAGCS